MSRPDGTLRAQAPPSPAANQAEQHLTLGAGQYVRLGITPASVPLVVRELNPEGSTIEMLELPATGDQPTYLSWLITSAGDYWWKVAPRDSSGANYAIWLEEQRPAGPCDAARQRAERTLLAARQALASPGEEPAARASRLLADSLDRWQGVGDRRPQLESLLADADAQARIGRKPAAAARFREALALAQEAGDRLGEARVLAAQALQLPGAQRLESLQAALALWRQLGDELGLAETLFGIGDYYNDEGISALALQSLRAAAELQRRNDDVRGEAKALYLIGGIYSKQGDAAHARAYLDLALARSNESGDPSVQANALLKSGDLHLLRSELQQAADEYSKAYQLLLSVGERTNAVWALISMANIALYFGEPEKARERFAEALTWFETLEDQEGRASALLGIGYALEAQRDTSGAAEDLERALAIVRENGLRHLEAVTLYELGKVHHQLGQWRRAIQELKRALELEGPDVSRAPQTLVELGKAYGKGGELAAADQAFKHAIQGSGGQGTLVEAAAQAGLARVERETGGLAAAATAIGKALEITEKLRLGVLRPDQRVSFLAARRAYYELDVDVLMRLHARYSNAGYDAAAVAASEKARSRSLLDLLDEDRAAPTRGIPPELRQRQIEIDRRITNLELQLRSRPGSATATERQRLEKELEQAGEEEKDLGAEIRRREATYAAFQAPSPLTLEQMQDLLDDRTALLEFFLGTESSFLFVLTRQRLTVQRLPTIQALEPLVRRMRAAISQDGFLSGKRYAEDAYELYRTLLLPVVPAIQDKPHLLVVPDGVLHLLPFEALLTERVPGAGAPRRDLPYLIRQRSVSYVPSSSVLALLQAERQPEWLPGAKLFVGFADPDHGQAREGQSSSGCEPVKALEATTGATRLPRDLGRLPPLPAARQEVCRIAGLFPSGEAVVFAGAGATEENIKSSTLISSTHSLHFATHGTLDETNPELSGLELAHSSSSEDGLLQVREIFNLRLHADLVVLSACQSGLGREVSGEGLIGMSRAFLSAGAGSLVVSLWPVDDESTADLMVSFYHTLRETRDKSAALRHAKLELIEHSPYYHPYYWAPFVLIGRPR